MQPVVSYLKVLFGLMLLGGVSLSCVASTTLPLSNICQIEWNAGSLQQVDLGKNISGLAIEQHGLSVQTPVNIWCSQPLNNAGAGSQLTLAVNATQDGNNQMALQSPQSTEPLAFSVCLNQKGGQQKCVSNSGAQLAFDLSQVNDFTDNLIHVISNSSNKAARSQQAYHYQVFLTIKVPPHQIVGQGLYHKNLQLYLGGKLIVMGQQSQNSAVVQQMHQIPENMNLNIQINSSCTIISTQGIHFGNKSSVSDFNPTQGGIAMICTQGTPYNITFTTQHPQTSKGEFAMQSAQNPADYLPYSLLLDSNKQLIRSGVPLQGFIGTGKLQQWELTGKILNQLSNVPSGKYQDTVRVTVQYS